MNGYLSGSHVARELGKLAYDFAELGYAETLSVMAMSSRVADTLEGLRLAAIMNIDEIAVEIVGADALANNPLNSGSWHKVANIKAVRKRTGSGLLEAKTAVERAYATVARNIAVAALENLADENSRLGYGLHERVNATDHVSVLDNLVAASDSVPF